MFNCLSNNVANTVPLKKLFKKVKQMPSLDFAFYRYTTGANGQQYEVGFDVLKFYITH